jgi:hypothetical protein
MEHRIQFLSSFITKPEKIYPMKHLTLNNMILLLAVTLLLWSCNNPSSRERSRFAEGPEKEWISLFDGETLDGWYTYQKQPEPTSEVLGLARDEDGTYLEPIGLNNDPLNVFSVVNEEGAPAIRISGEVFGILVTEKEFENYHLSVEFKWGQEKYPPRRTQKRDSGILYKSVGPEGAWGGVWMKSLECQVQEGDCGDYISVDTVLADIRGGYDPVKQWDFYSPDSAILTFSPSRSYCHKNQDYENPTGEWNTMEIFTVGSNSVHVVNGKVNMRISNSRQILEGREVPLTRGKIQLQSEGAEIFYRNIRLRPIEDIPTELMAP